MPLPVSVPSRCADFRSAKRLSPSTIRTWQQRACEPSRLTVRKLDTQHPGHTLAPPDVVGDSNPRLRRVDGYAAAFGYAIVIGLQWGIHCMNGAGFATFTNNVSAVDN